MDTQKRYAMATGAALLLSLGGVAAAAMPALAEGGTSAPGTTHSHSVTKGHEDGSDDGETADDRNEPRGTEKADDAAQDRHERGESEKGEKRGAEGAEHSEKNEKNEKGEKSEHSEKGESRDAETNDDHAVTGDHAGHAAKDARSDGETADNAQGGQR